MVGDERKATRAATLAASAAAAPGEGEPVYVEAQEAQAGSSETVEGELNIYNELSERITGLQETLQEVCRQNDTLTKQNKSLEGRLSKLISQQASVSSHSSSGTASTDPGRSTSSTFGTPVSIMLDRDKIPLFKADAPSTQPFRRNQDIESWIRQIELCAQPETDAGRIRAARAYSRGTAEQVINSALFESITTWAEFRQQLKKIFRGTVSSTDFHKYIHEKRLVAGQAPQDLYLDLQAIIYQGVRDYPLSVSNPQELIRITFLQALPHWLRKAVTLLEDGPLEELVSAAQRYWNLETRHKQSSLVGAASSDGTPDAKQPSTWCTYHRSSGHSSEDCRARGDQGRARGGPMVCWRCGKQGHMRRDCSFRHPQGAPAQDVTGREDTGTDGDC